LGHPCKFQRVWRLGSVTARHSSSGRQPNCGVEQRAPPIFDRATITLGIDPHSSFVKNNKQATYKSRQSAVLTGHGLQVSKSPVAGVQ